MFFFALFSVFTVSLIEKTYPYYPVMLRGVMYNYYTEFPFHYPNIKNILNDLIKLKDIDQNIQKLEKMSMGHTNGHADFILGNIYEFGLFGRETDDDKAKYYYEMGSSLNNKECQSSLAFYLKFNISSNINISNTTKLNSKIIKESREERIQKLTYSSADEDVFSMFRKSGFLCEKKKYHAAYMSLKNVAKEAIRLTNFYEKFSKNRVTKYPDLNIDLKKLDSHVHIPLKNFNNFEFRQLKSSSQIYNNFFNMADQSEEEYNKTLTEDIEGFDEKKTKNVISKIYSLLLFEENFDEGLKMIKENEKRLVGIYHTLLYHYEKNYGTNDPKILKSERALAFKNSEIDTLIDFPILNVKKKLIKRKNYDIYNSLVFDLFRFTHSLTVHMEIGVLIHYDNQFFGKDPIIGYKLIKNCSTWNSVKSFYYLAKYGYKRLEKSFNYKNNVFQERSDIEEIEYSKTFWNLENYLYRTFIFGDAKTANIKMNKKDYKKAIPYFRRFADIGSIDSFYNLEKLYESINDFQNVEKYSSFRKELEERKEKEKERNQQRKISQKNLRVYFDESWEMREVNLEESIRRLNYIKMAKESSRVLIELTKIIVFLEQFPKSVQEMILVFLNYKKSEDMSRNSLFCLQYLTVYLTRYFILFVLLFLLYLLIGTTIQKIISVEKL